MECSSCLNALAAGARFCAHCGTAVAQLSDEAADPLRELLRIALGQQYAIMRLLGRGGMGAVYLARETSLNREVAIKVLPTHQNATAESRERFRREARTAARLSHPNIVPLHTFGDVDGTLFFVMGYVKGESLAEKLRREGRLEIDTARRILTEIAQALEYAHSLGIVHRDIKPDNVLIEETTGRAILTDFGVAKPLGAGDTLTVQGSLLGTPHYMSPEQASGKSDIDHRSDLYSLGIMGYAMLAGRLPFEGKTTGDVLVQHITIDAPALKTLAPDVPVELSVALTRCLAKEPGKRWHDAAEFRANLAEPGEEDLPQAFADLREVTRSLLIFLLLSLYATTWFVAEGHRADDVRAVIVFYIGLLSIVMPIMMGAFKWRTLRKIGYDSSVIARETLKQPKTWIGWYPRRFRAKVDVWDRLPIDLCRARNSLTAFVGSTLFLIFPFWIVMLAKANDAAFDIAQLPAWSIAMVSGLPFLFLMSGAFFQLRWRRKARAEGVYDADIEAQLITASTAPSSFWSKPAVARLLSPFRRTATPRTVAQPASPDELIAAITSIVSALDFPARELGERALMAARKLGVSLDTLNEEITALAMTSDPAERDRLTVKLEALGSVAAAGRSDVREMLQQQLALVQTLESRFADAKNQLGKRAELLKTLWLQVVALSAADGSVRSSDTVDRVRALCDEIGGHVARETESEQVTVARRAENQPTMLRDPQ